MKQGQANYLEDHYKTPVMFQAQSGEAVVPSDTTDLQAGVLYVGAEGTLKIQTRLGSDLTFVGVTAGSFLPVVATRVYATDTTASSILILR